MPAAGLGSPAGCRGAVVGPRRDGGGGAARKGLQDRHEVFAALQKTVLAVLRRLACKGVARAVGLADGERACERA